MTVASDRGRMMGHIRDPRATTFREVGRPRFALCLSGGGLRATFFHFGVVRALAEADRLKDVTDIIAVSGGSILAAHIIRNWEAYAGPQKDLARMEQELRTMSARGMRERVVRRWIVKGVWNALVTGFGYFSERRPYSQSLAIQEEFERFLGKGTVADCYRNRPPAERPPQVHFMCTNFNSGEACCFTSDEFVIYRKPPTSIGNGATSAEGAADHDPDLNARKKIRMAVSSDTIELTYAVAASSAFPGLFPAMEINNSQLGASARDFPVTVRLSDGGIYDNLGLEHFKELVRQSERRKAQAHAGQASEEPDRAVKSAGTEATAVLVSNASGAFQWDNSNDYYGLLPRNLRTIDILMDLMVEERWDQTPDDLARLSSGGAIHLIRANIGNAVWDDNAPPISVQQQIQDIRTDLNVFTKEEIDLLIEHGHRTALHEAGVERLASGQSASPAAYSTPRKGPSFRALDRIVKHANRKGTGLFDWRDEWSVGLGVVLLAGVFLALSPLIGLNMALKEKSKAEVAKAEAKMAAEKAAYSEEKSAKLEEDKKKLEEDKKKLENEKKSFAIKSMEDDHVIEKRSEKVAALEESIRKQAPGQQVANADIDRAARDVSESIRQAKERLVIGKSAIVLEPTSGSLAPAEPLAASPVEKPSYRVWIQFAGSFKREEMIAFGTALKAGKGWTNAPGAEQGGEQTEKSTGLLEVRYGPPEDETAARALTQDILDLKIVPRMNNPRRVSIIPKGSLEIWISK